MDNLENMIQKFITPVQKSLIVVFYLMCFSAFSQTPSNPVIKDYGTIYDMEKVVKPEPSKLYKIVIDLKVPVSDPSELNWGLVNAARLLNLHVTGGIPKENIQLTLAVHAGATNTIMNNEAYQEKHGVENPNLDLISQLKEAGVEIYVCGQSLLARNYDREKVNPDVSIALSMLTVVTEKTMNDYTLMVFQ